MNKFINSLYGRISAVFLILLLIVGVVQILITINSSLKFVWESPPPRPTTDGTPRIIGA